MLYLFPVILPLLITDIINPVLLAAVIYSLGSNKPFLNSIFILLGWFLLYFIAGIARFIIRLLHSIWCNVYCSSYYYRTFLREGMVQVN